MDKTITIRTVLLAASLLGISSCSTELTLRRNAELSPHERHLERRDSAGIYIPTRFEHNLTEPIYSRVLLPGANLLGTPIR